MLLIADCLVQGILWNADGFITGHEGLWFNLLAPELFVYILAHAVYKMWIIQGPNKLELWNKLQFEEEKTESIYRV